MERFRFRAIGLLDNLTSVLIWIARLPLLFVGKIAGVGGNVWDAIFHVFDFFSCLFGRLLLPVLLIGGIAAAIPLLGFPLMIVSLCMLPGIIVETWKLTR